MSDVTHILNAIESGDAQAAEQLLPRVYDELRTLAAAQMAREKPGQTLDATALVHEAWLRLVPSAACGLAFSNRQHFFAAAAEAMRRILVENARRKRSLKRGGGFVRSGVDPSEIPAPDESQFDLDLDEALARLAVEHPLKADLVKLRYFAGLTLEEAAETLAISPATADRWWAYSRSWLRVEIERLRQTDTL